MTIGSPINADTFLERIGVYGDLPAVTPKYTFGEGVRKDYIDTQARMFIQVPAAEYDFFLNSLVDNDSIELAKVLAGDEESVGGVGYIDFGLEMVDINLEEKVQIMETLADNSVVFFFGQATPIFTFTGFLLNTRQNDWAHSFLKLYSNILRGTELAARRKVLRIRWDSKIASGAIINLRLKQTSIKQQMVAFSFQYVVTNLQYFPVMNLAPTQLDNAFPFSPTKEYRLKEEIVHQRPQVKSTVAFPKKLPSGTSKTKQEVEEVTNADYKMEAKPPTQAEQERRFFRTP